MSVLLDALKKAAEDKKNADSLVAEADQDVSSFESLADPQESSNLELKLAVPDNNYEENIDSIVQTDSDNEIVELDNEESKVTSQEELPTFSLKSTDESLSEDLVDSDLDFKIKIQSEEDRNIQANYEMSGNDLESLIDSLDIDASLDVNNVSLERSGTSSANMLAGLSAEQDTQSDIESGQQSLNTQGQELKGSDDFNWSMDDLPGYETSNNINDNKIKQSNSLSQNPILINGENTPPKTNKKYATSTRIIVSLVVVLLFIGIGFYGMLYYQEQNEDLEFSMRKYNLSKMQFTQPKPASDTSRVLQESFEDASTTSTLNRVTDKVITLGSSIKDAVTNQLNDNSQKQVALHDSSGQLPVTLSESVSSIDSEADVSARLESKRVSNTTKTRSQSSQNKANRDAKYNSSKKLTAKVVKPPSNVDGSLVTITTARSSLSKAYSAYESGDFQQANKMFNEALLKEPRNINALLGLGGIAVAQGNNYSALNYYQKVLDMEPNNIYAFESIANLSGKMRLNKTWEDELFAMSLKYPSSAVLQYAKGNILAKKNDWLAAQESYFKAYALDSGNPDYMVNLAVSYDHLGKYELAAQYYTQALGFASGSNASFDKKHVRDRLVSLRQFISQGY